MGTRPAIITSQLSRSFGRFVAVESVSIKVMPGQIIGLLGANGAGKSTLIRMLSGILRPTSGTGSVAGFDLEKKPEEVKKNIGYMSQKFSLYPDLTVMENIRFFSGIYELESSREKKRTSWVLEMAGLAGKEGMITQELSGGWKQRLALGCAILHSPTIVFLDEPTGGVDPVSRRSFWELITGLAQGGTTVLVTTHYLDEAEYCNRVYLMHAGRIIREGSPHELKTGVLKGTMLEITADDPSVAMELLAAQDWVVSTSLFGTRLHCRLGPESNGSAACKSRVLACFRKAGLPRPRVLGVLPALEDVFISLISQEGKEARVQ